MTIANPAVPFSSAAQFYGTTQPFLGPAEVRICQQEFAHDTAVLSFWAGDVDSNSFSSGMPMQITWGRIEAKRTFVGYVSHPSRTNNALAGTAGLMGRNSITVVCAGASWPMKEPGTLTFRNQTATQVVRSIAALFNLDVNVIDHPMIWPVLHMAGQSYWTFCCMLAHRIGYTFYCSGTTIVFKPRQLDPRNISGYMTVYNYRSDPGSLAVFSPVLGAANPTGGQLRNRHLYDVNQRTTQVVYANLSGSPAQTVLGTNVDDPIFDETEHMVVHSQEEAATKVNGKGQANQLYITAEASAAGNAFISQGSMIAINNANGSQNGLWYVTQADHFMDNKHFKLQMCLGRDSLGASPNIAGVVQTQLPSSPILRNGAWQAVI